jgi:hypothetical protein
LSGAWSVERRRGFAAGIGVAFILVAAGCASPEQRRDAINAVNKVFQAEYERMLNEKGTRVFKDLGRDSAFATIRTSLARLGMRLESHEPQLGFISVYAPAPAPLDREEWRKAGEKDLPRLRELARPYVGSLADFINFEPQGLEILITATAVEVRGGTEISLTTRMREIVPPASGMPRREYPPPTAVSMALDKIWSYFEQELRAAAPKS